MKSYFFNFYFTCPPTVWIQHSKGCLVRAAVNLRRITLDQRTVSYLANYSLFFFPPFLVPVGRMGEVLTLLAKPYSMGSSDPVSMTPQEFSYTFSSLPLLRG